jgi:DNA-binding transcriptional LysR family regulator
MSDPLVGLTALICVAEKRSFTRAAAELRVTPSAVSQTIHALEERVGVRLLQRTTRSVGLTEAGARFVARLKPALEEVQGAFNSLGELRDRPSGVLKLRMPRFAFTHVLKSHLGRFLRDNPDVDVEVSIDDDASSLVKEGLDAGIHLGETIGQDMIAVRVTDDQRMTVVGSPAYFATHRKPRHPRELHEHDCINYRKDLDAPVYRWEFTDKGKDFQVAVEGRLLVSDREAMLAAALDGLGLAYVAESRAREFLTNKQLIPVLQAYCPPFPGLFLYYPSRRNIAPKLKALVECIKKSA